MEELALQHYAAPANGGWQGLHTEGGVWSALFALLMWDVLFAGAQLRRLLLCAAYVCVGGGGSEIGLTRPLLQSCACVCSCCALSSHSRRVISIGSARRLPACWRSSNQRRSIFQCQCLLSLCITY